MKLNAQEALDLAKQFADCAHLLQKYRFDNWKKLKPTQRQNIEEEEWSLNVASSDMITKAVGLALDESKSSLKALKKSVSKAKSAIKKLKQVKQVLTVAAALVGLGAAVISKDPGAIAKNAKLVLDTATA